MRSELPQIFISWSDRKRLMRAVTTAYRHREPTAAFLSAEIRRAQFCDPKKLPSAIVTVSSMVNYRLDWGPASGRCQLVYPEDFTGDAGQISLLSRIGVALLGLRIGDRMPVFMPGFGFRTLDVVDVK